MKRPDGPAILGLLILAGLLSVGALVLIGLERSVPPEVWALIAGAIGAVGGWVGKTITTEGTVLPLLETTPEPVVQAETVTPLPIRTPAVYPLRDDRLGPVVAATQPATAATDAEVAARSQVTP